MGTKVITFGVRIFLVPVFVLNLLLLPPTPAGGAQRVLPPEFEGSYQIPSPMDPYAGEGPLELLDLFALLGALSLASWLAITRRSRTGLYWLAAGSMLYFGFYRRGCICAVGAVQNVVLSFVDPTYEIPLRVLAFFFLPLLFALFFGRVFCASVCPLGAIQELFILKPVRVPPPVGHVLSLLPFTLLGLTLLLAATQSTFLICRLDFFVGFFRRSGPPEFMVAGGLLLLVGIFVARPYCRFLCPYGVLLGWFSSFSPFSRRDPQHFFWGHLRITPADCIQCRLCEDSCPVDAIVMPTLNSGPPGVPPSVSKSGLRQLGLFLILTPLFILFAGFSFSRFHLFLAREHPVVRLSEQIRREETGTALDTTLESEAFRGRLGSHASLHAQAQAIRANFQFGLWLVGMFVGSVFAWKLIAPMLSRRQYDYEPDRFLCVSCGRCMPFCPVKAAKGDEE